MDTKIWSVDKFVTNLEDYPQISEAAALLKENEVVAFPTETVYGLGGNADSDTAVAKIFEAKGRPADNPLIIHIAKKEQLDSFVDGVPEKAGMLMDHFWPGPLTIVFNKKAGQLSAKATAGLSTVAVRMPDHPVALALIKKTGLPIAAPSANQSGKPSPTSAQHVHDDLYGRISGIIDGGATGVGVESTVIDCTGPVPVILRPGGATVEQIEAVVGKVQLDPALADQEIAPKSPGMKYQHYAPNAPLYLVEGSRDFLQELINEKRKLGLKAGVLTTEENVAFFQADAVLGCGSRDKPETVASSLYDTLREFNAKDLDVIFSEVFPRIGVGEAVMNRLMKAAGQRLIKEE
ncbi:MULTISPECIES: L-threonylcarbamoyladenylate synthase [Bacillus]|uniref:L-threonylcarbamoyladenylate synthase n=1 Tax=Bacillus TaxID=1386 RepID=UPI000C78D30C|nr:MULTISPECIES: L-threonylcarbamoyladenylate synthase [Bacillus]PLR85484.1 threonylcarbamoyl-AMP synthase [Bacillus sp. V33-4]RSK57509.1 threonylcarbamoyl-AMP synthase [Bacillus canaveralius]